jgi:hypothetical protein
MEALCDSLCQVPTREHKPRLTWILKDNHSDWAQPQHKYSVSEIRERIGVCVKEARQGRHKVAQRDSTGFRDGSCSRSPARGDIRYFRTAMPPLTGLRSPGSTSTHGFRRGPDYAGPYGPRVTRIRYVTELLKQEC